MAVHLPAQPNFLTLACRDVERVADLLRGFGGRNRPGASPRIASSCTNGVVIAPYGAEHYEPHFGPAPDGFRAFTLGINLASPADVDAAYAALESVDGVELLGEPLDSPHGFRGFSFRDPEGNIWDVAWKRGSTVAEDGSLTWVG